MLFFVCGPHGVGKSTIISNISRVVSRPIVPIINLDMSEQVIGFPVGAPNQFIRHAIYFETISKVLSLPHDFIMIVDRAPESLNIYDKVLLKRGLISKKEYSLLEKDYLVRSVQLNKLINDSSHTRNFVYLMADGETIMNNIRERGRDKKFTEDDGDYLSLVIDAYQDLINNHKSNNKLVIKLCDHGDHNQRGNMFLEAEQKLLGYIDKNYKESYDFS